MTYLKDQHWYQGKSDDVKLEISSGIEKFFDFSNKKDSGKLGQWKFKKACRANEAECLKLFNYFKDEA